MQIGLLVLAALIALILAARGYLLALGLLVVLTLLLWDRLRTWEWLRRIAGRIEHRQPLEKLEVAQGTWGELCRAINTLMQEQHTLLHRASLQPSSLPPAALAYLRDESIPEEGWQREVAVLVLGPHANDLENQQRWRLLAQLAFAESQRHQALLLPCATGVQLVFGAFREQPRQESLQRALGVARAIAENYRYATQAGLAAGLASGRAFATLTHGLGFSVIGAPVERALALQQLGHSPDEATLRCDERDYLRIYQGHAAERGLLLPLRRHPPAQGVYTVQLDETSSLSRGVGEGARG
jgi:hypothetical protein